MAAQHQRAAAAGAAQPADDVRPSWRGVPDVYLEADPGQPLGQEARHVPLAGTARHQVGVGRVGPHQLCQQVGRGGNERVGETDGSDAYRFLAADDFNIRKDTPVRVIAGRQDVAGIPAKFLEDWLLVGLEKDLGPNVAAALPIQNGLPTADQLLDNAGHWSSQRLFRVLEYHLFHGTARRCGAYGSRPRLGGVLGKCQDKLWAGWFLCSTAGVSACLRGCRST